MRDVPAADHEVEYIAGALALDFTNTLGGSYQLPTHEHIRSYEDLVEFVRGADVLANADTRSLRAAAGARPRDAERVVQRALGLRDSLFRLFSALAAGRKAPPSDLAAVTEAAREAYGHARLDHGASGTRWRIETAGELEAPLWPIALSAVDLLRDHEVLAQVRECASETCSWLFLDRSRNHTRRWCDMTGCGNRAKVRRFRERTKRATRRGRSGARG